MSEIEQLERAIAALEEQRPLLGDAVVEAALAPMREKLVSLKQPAEEQRKLVTALFADLVGFTAMSEKMDPEDVQEVVNAYFKRWTSVIEAWGGVVEKFIGDAVVAVFGLAVAQEDDPERSLHAALAMREELNELNRELERTRSLRLAMRIGIHTGPVVVGLLGDRARRSDGQDFTVVGDTMNLASRLQTHAPEGGILISHDTYRHVRGLFEVKTLDPIRVKGKSEPVQVYLVVQAKPRAFHLGTRGVEGVETRTIGREAELRRLKDALTAAIEDGERYMVTVAGEAGIGKTRLMGEFENWAELLSEKMIYFTGRAHPSTQNQAYSLLRDMFSFRFGIQDSDSPATVQAKMEAGIAHTALKVLRGAEQEQGSPSPETLEQAHFIGQWLGFDFKDSPYLRDAQADARLVRDRAYAALIEYLRAVTAQITVVILLEDIHWADDSSLDVIEELAGHLANEKVMILCTARPTLFERRPDWGENLPFHIRLDLQPLSRRQSRLLIDEILQKADSLPEELRELVVENAEGNPFYIEELIKMMIEDGIIIKEAGNAPGEERWRVAQAQLAGVRVPPTLIGVLQARFDSLKPEERRLLQRASVIGRVFWDQAVRALSDAPQAVLGPGENRWERPPGDRVDVSPEPFRRLQAREMIYLQSPSTFEDTRQYQFKHTLLRDVTYESVLRRDRRTYHAQAARWLEEVTRKSGRTDEYAALIADHYDRAGEAGQAARWFREAGKGAASLYANAEAVRLFSRALERTPAERLSERFDLLMDREQVYHLQGMRQAQEQDLEALDEIACRLEEGTPAGESVRARVALRRANMREVTGEYALSVEEALQAIRLASEKGDLESEACANARLGSALWRQARIAEARLACERGLVLAREAGAPVIESDALRLLGILAQSGADYPAARQYYEQALHIKREIGDRRGEAAVLNSLGVLLFDQGDYTGARSLFEGSLRIKRQIGDRPGENNTLNNLALIAYRVGDYAAAREYFERCRRISNEIGDQEGIASTLGGLGSIDLLLGDTGRAQRRREQALELFRSIGDLQGMSGELTSLAFLKNLVGEYQQALDFAQEGLRLGRESGYPLNQALALAELGHARLNSGQPGQAIEAYLEGLEIFRQAGVNEQASDLLAGLARAYLAQGDGQNARATVDEIWRNLEKVQREGEQFPGQALAGNDNPILVYLTCYEIFLADPDAQEQARLALEAGSRLLQSRANLIAAKSGDTALVRAYLDSFPTHRKLLDLVRPAEGQTGKER
jgi:class 3 adenylate cyclase/predicted ATPase